jgi:uncharacterized protein YcfJ
MRKFIVALSAVAVAIPTAIALPAPKAEAKSYDYSAGYSADQRRRYAYREWRGRDGRRYCRKPNGTTGLVVGGVAGALVGRSIDTRGDRATGTILGAAAGALAGREIERSGSRRRCR